MIEDRVDDRLVAVHHVQDTARKAGLEGQLCQPYRDRRVALGRLQDERVPASDRGGEHPERDHCREVEWSDAGNNAKWLPHRVNVEARTCTFGIFALE